MAWLKLSGYRCDKVKQLRIVLVEDDALIGMLLEEQLESLGHSVVHIAVTEPQAVASAARFSPDLMIVDVNLAHGDGVSAMRTILSAGAMRHVFMTGATDEGVPSGAIKLRKPFQRRHLVHALDLALAQPAPGSRPETLGPETLGPEALAPEALASEALGAAA